VVEFLVDNTLGRTWYEMRQGYSGLADQCRYMVRRKHPIFLGPEQAEPTPWPDDGEVRAVEMAQIDMWTRTNRDLQQEQSIWGYGLTIGYPEAAAALAFEENDDLTGKLLEVLNAHRAGYDNSGRWEGSFEELRTCLFIWQRDYRWSERTDEIGEPLFALNRAIAERWDAEVESIPFRSKKDPRQITILDPACGSGHFLLYSFDVLQTVYEEAWTDTELGPQLWSDLGWAPPHVRDLVDDPDPALFANPMSVELLAPETECFRCGKSVPTNGARFVLASYGTSWLAGRPLVYCSFCAGISETALDIPLTALNFSEALAKGWFSHRTGTEFLVNAEAFNFRRGCEPQGMFEVLEAASKDESLAVLRSALPELILRHNLHGVDIDPRAVQIAGLALWLRAQRAFLELGVPLDRRPQIRRGNLVCAEPMPGEADLLDRFLQTLDPRIRELVATIWQRMKLAGEAGVLLRLERELEEELQRARAEAGVDLPPVQVRLFQPGRPEVQSRMDFSTQQERDFWSKAEQQIVSALEGFARQSSVSATMQSRLFAEDAIRGFGLFDLCRRPFDVVLMNPPFGQPSIGLKPYIVASYPASKSDMFAVFVERGLDLLRDDGLLGAITSRMGFFLTSFKTWRQAIILDLASPVAFADLGHGVMDSAMVEAAAYCLRKAASTRSQAGGRPRSMAALV
jgi:hypothetical protein